LRATTKGRKEEKTGFVAKVLASPTFYIVIMYNNDDITVPLSLSLIRERKREG
jgi:hypothetical protein